MSAHPQVHGQVFSDRGNCFRGFGAQISLEVVDVLRVPILHALVSRELRFYLLTAVPPTLFQSSFPLILFEPYFPFTLFDLISLSGFWVIGLTDNPL